MRNMSATRPIGIIVVAILFTVAGCSIERRPPVERRGTEVVEGAYLGEAAPDSLPRLFAPGRVSTNDEERDAAWSPDGQELYYTVAGPRPTIVRVRLEGGRWGTPEVAPFSGRYSDLEPAFSPDGASLLFASNRPLDGLGDPKDDFDIWVVERTAGIWSPPRNLGEPVNTEGNEYYPSISVDGTLIWTVDRPGGTGGEDIWTATASGTAFRDPRPLGPGINTPGPEFNACISPSGQRIVFSGYGRPDGFGGGDLYVSRLGPDGTWGAARNLGSTINTPGLEYCPSFSPDSRYLFFSRRGGSAPLPDRRVEYEELKGFLAGPENGRVDIYWVPTAALPE